MKKWKYLRIAGLAASAGVLFLMLGWYGVALSYVYLAPSIPSVESMRHVDLQVPLRVYTRSGQLIAQIGEQRRIPVPYDQIPEIVKQSFLSAEDDRFFEHHGIDFLGTFRAIIVDVITGKKAQGASTITQQAARNVFLTLDKTFRRKLVELFVTYKMEDEFTKQEIFNLYLNDIFFGQRAYGVAAAAETFFGKTLDQLTVAEAATIAGMPQAPSRYNPIINPQAAVARRTYVLRRLRERNIIDDATAEAANREPMSARTHALPYDIEAPYVAEMARLQLRKRFGPKAESDGYKVFTTLDGRLQEAANRAVRLGLIEYDRRHGYRGPLSHADAGANSKPEQLESIISEHPTIGNLVPAIVVSTSPKSAKVFVHLHGLAQIDWDGLSWARKALTASNGDATLGPSPKTTTDVIKRGDVIYVVADSQGHAQLAQEPQVQSALVSLDPHDGAVAALVGGFDYFTNKYNRATQARRQPGSGFKPFLYSSSLEHGFTAASTLPDSPLVTDSPDVETSYRPKEDSNHFGGPMRLREALYLSKNLVSERLLKELGTQYVIEYAKRFGFDPKLNSMPSDLTLALGTMVATPMDMATAYATFANGGYKVSPYFIDRIVDADGNVVFSATPKVVCDTCAPDHAASLKDLPGRKPGAAGGADFLKAADAIRGPDVPADQLAPSVISAQNDFIMTDIMSDVIKKGTGRRALQLNRTDLAGKTGTTNSSADTWFNGFNSRLVATVWVGYDQAKPLGAGEEGSSTALPVWIHYMREALKGVPDVRRPSPEGVVQVRISPVTGALVSQENPEGISEWFFQDKLPTAQAADSATPSTGAPASEGSNQSGSSIF